jgi:saccharopepsin
MHNSDFLIGDNFLRSVYSVYDFGDFDSSGDMGNPYMRFLSLVSPDEASVEFHELRGGAPNTNIVYTGLSGAALSLGSSLSNESLGMIAKFIPPVLALVAFNSLVLIICCIVWLVSFIRKRRTRAIPRLPRSRLSRSIPMNDTSSYIADESFPSPFPSPSGMHVYEPVSMALSEDTFVPPTPAFYSESGKLQRPKSFA